MRRGRLVLILALTVFLAPFPCPWLGAAEEGPAADEAVLRRANLGTSGSDLVAFLRKRSLSLSEEQQLRARIRQLGSPKFLLREQAAEEIVVLRPAALALLQQASRDPDLEISRRVEACAERIRQAYAPLTALPAAAVHLLTRDRPPEAIPALLDYLPFVDDEWLEEEILTTLNKLSERSEATPLLLAALQDKLPIKRAAAAYVLGRSTDQAQRSLVYPLLSDPSTKVRLRAAQALVTAHEKKAVPALVALLGAEPVNLTWQAEELLYRIAGEQAPRVTLGTGSAESRQKCLDAWTAWWQSHGSAVNLEQVEEETRQLGLTVVAEMDSNKVWEFGLDGKPRWKLENLQGPMDAQVLSGGRVLIAEYQGQRVTERDLQGNILWEKRLTGNPIACQRLANGNTFIATHNTLLEVTRDGKEIYSHNRGAGFFVFSAQKLRNEHIVCISSQGMIVEVDATTGKDLKTIRQMNNQGGWCGIEALTNGRFLIATLSNGKVTEMDESGKALWECSAPGACHATRLPNGHTLVACMATRRVVELDRDGNKVQEQITDGRPWRVHRR